MPASVNTRAGTPLPNSRSSRESPARLEEVRVDPELRILQDIPPDRKDPGLHGGEVRRPAIRGRVARRAAQGGEVDLPVGREREFRKEDKGGRDHVARQTLGGVPREEASQIRAGIALPRDDEGDELHGPGSRRARNDHRPTNFLVLPEAGRDLSRFDSVSADLDLVVESRDVLEHPLGSPSHAVAGAVEARTGPSGERVRREAIRAALGLADVAERDTVASRDELSGDSERSEPPVRVEDVDRRVGDGHADRNRPRRLDVLAPDHVAARERRVLGGAVSVDEP